MTPSMPRVESGSIDFWPVVSAPRTLAWLSFSTWACVKVFMKFQPSIANWNEKTAAPVVVQPASLHLGVENHAASLGSIMWLSENSFRS